MSTPSLDSLPYPIICAIFSNLVYTDINRIRGTCKFLCSVCGEFLKQSINDVRNELHKCMYEINSKFINKNLPLDERGVLLRAYNTLEILALSLNTLVVLNRHILERNDVCLPIGDILDNFLLVINAMRFNMFGSWPTYGMQLHNKIRKFAENMEKTNPTLKMVIPMGVRTMDLLDMLMDAKYEICTIYDIPGNLCFITGTYKLADSRFLAYLPDISFVSDCSDRQLSKEESDILMKYLVLLVNVHNGLFTKSEQYRRELEFSRRSLLHDSNEYIHFNHWSESLKDPKRDYFLRREPFIRDVLDTKGEVMEVYTNPIGTTSNIDEGVICSMQMKCSLDQAPLQIKESFELLKTDIMLGDKSVDSINPEILNITNAEDHSYTASLKLAIRLPHNKKQMIDLNFKDGEVLSGSIWPCIDDI